MLPDRLSMPIAPLYMPRSQMRRPLATRNFREHDRDRKKCEADERGDDQRIAPESIRDLGAWNVNKNRCRELDSDEHTVLRNRNAGHVSHIQDREYIGHPEHKQSPGPSGLAIMFAQPNSFALNKVRLPGNHAN